MIIAIFSIFFLTGIVFILNKKLPIQICPICAGVTLTWLWMLFGMGLGFLSVPRYEFITAILMGASIGGIVTEFKKLFLKYRNNSSEKNKKVKSLEEKMKNCC